VTVILIKCLS